LLWLATARPFVSLKVKAFSILFGVDVGSKAW